MSLHKSLGIVILVKGSISFIIIALSRPQGVLVEQEITSQGIDIMLALDVSGSMAAEDFKPNNRLAVAKKTINDFKCS